jgi:hypothetical protein
MPRETSLAGFFSEKPVYFETKKKPLGKTSGDATTVRLP